MASQFSDLYLRVDGVDLHRVALELAYGRDPVSYTHLRAHETVLDLVCRLLLEKKKNYPKSSPSTLPFQIT